MNNCSSKSIKNLIIILFILLISGCTENNRDSKNTDFIFSVDWEEQILFTVNFEVYPLPSLEEKSKLEIQITPKMPDISVEIDFITEEKYRLISPNLSRQNMIFGQTYFFERDIEFIENGPTVLFAVFNISLPYGKNDIKRAIPIYFFIPGKIDGNIAAKKIGNEIDIPRVSKFPTKAHEAIDIN